LLVPAELAYGAIGLVIVTALAYGRSFVVKRRKSLA
jgi:hypothetical protein